MSFEVEDGTGLELATSYVDLDFATAYFTRKNLLTWWSNLSIDVQQNELINGSEYLDNKFANDLKGTPLNIVQSLEFPRISLYDRYGRAIVGVPVEVKNAVCEYALLSQTGKLYPATSQANPLIKSKTVKVGPITTSTEFVDGVTSVYLKHTYADSFMRGFTNGTSGNVQVIRG